jgi:glycosyltransferase involved in cell wall biosynthesis
LELGKILYNDDKEKLVSIIMPSYNSELYIRESIASIIEQSYHNWELIITDDGSSDSTIRIIKEYVSQDNRIILIESKENAGAGAARNSSIKKARGEFIAFLDSDDLWFPEKLKKQIGFMLVNDYSFTYSYYQKISNNNRGSIIKAKSEITYEELIHSNIIGCLTVIYNASKLGERLMPTIRKRQDMALWLDLLKTTKKAYCLQENLALYRTDSGMTKNKTKVIQSQWQFYRTTLELPLGKTIFIFIKYAVKGIIKHKM